MKKERSERNEGVLEEKSAAGEREKKGQVEM